MTERSRLLIVLAISFAFCHSKVQAQSETIVFTVALGFLFFQSREAVRQEAISHASQILDKPCWTEP